VSDRHVVAMGGGGFSMDDPVLDRYVLDVVDSPRPKVCFLPTATSNVATYVTRFLDAFPARSFETTFLDLFDRTVSDLHSFLAEQDVVYVGGGNTANLLAVWRVHGVDVALRAAWEAGVVVAGVSAGANCWFEASTTDSFLRGRADPLIDGLGVLAGSFCPHYDSEPERRPRFREYVASGTLPPGFAADDFAGLHFVGADLAEVVASRPGAGAYRVLRGDTDAHEEPLPVRRLA
jgi:dipeptidase E